METNSILLIIVTSISLIVGAILAINSFRHSKAIRNSLAFDNQLSDYGEIHLVNKDVRIVNLHTIMEYRSSDRLPVHVIQRNICNNLATEMITRDLIEIETEKKPDPMDFQHPDHRDTIFVARATIKVVINK